MIEKKLTIYSEPGLFAKHLLGREFTVTTPSSEIITIETIDTLTRGDVDVKYVFGDSSTRPTPHTFVIQSEEHYRKRLAEFEKLKNEIEQAPYATSYYLVRGRDRSHGRQKFYMYREYFGGVWRNIPMAGYGDITDAITRDLKQFEAVRIEVCKNLSVRVTNLNAVYSENIPDDVSRLTLMSEHSDYGV